MPSLPLRIRRQLQQTIIEAGTLHQEINHELVELAQRLRSEDHNTVMAFLFMAASSNPSTSCKDCPLVDACPDGAPWRNRFD
jgi:hypothetical protein